MPVRQLLLGFLDDEVYGDMRPVIAIAHFQGGINVEVRVTCLLRFFPVDRGGRFFLWVRRVS